jgi:Xaa-Pro aminopeptidase
MEERQLDALMVTEEANYTYFSGHRSTQNPGDKVRPYVLILPLHEEPVVFVMPFEEGHIKLTTWFDWNRNVRTYKLFKHNDALEEGIRELGLSKARIGCELGREQYLEFSFNDFNELRSRLATVQFVDASDLLLTLRSVKSSLEIERCRAAAQIASRALDRVLQAVRPGMTNVDVARLVRRFIAEEGGEKVHRLAIASGFDMTKAGKVSVPTPRVLEPGDTLTIDTGAGLLGYVSDICRTAVVGRATQKQKDMYKFVLELTERCREAVRVGSACEEAALACQQEVARAGRKTQGVGRIGHGVGRESPEYPSLAIGEKLSVAPGMIFSCNPNFLTEFGFFNSEEEFLITAGGYEFLSAPQAAPEIRELGDN